MLEKTEWQSRIDLGHSDTDNTEYKTQIKKQHTQHRKLNRWTTQTRPKNLGDPRCLQGVSNACFFLNTSVMLLVDQSCLKELSYSLILIQCSMHGIPLC